MFEVIHERVQVWVCASVGVCKCVRACVQVRVFRVSFKVSETICFEYHINRKAKMSPVMIPNKPVEMYQNAFASPTCFRSSLMIQIPEVGVT